MTLHESPWPRNRRDATAVDRTQIRSAHPGGLVWRSAGFRRAMSGRGPVTPDGESGGANNVAFSPGAAWDR